MALPRDPSTPVTQRPPRPVSNSGSPAATPTAAKPAAPKPAVHAATAAAPKPASSSSGADLRRFFTDVLRGLGIAANTQNVTAMMAWAQAEGGHAGFNPLNTTQRYAGASNYNSVGVKNYASYADGVAATVQTLRNGHYTPILQALKTNPGSIGAAISATPWGTSGTLVTRILSSGQVQNRTLAGAPAGTTAYKGTVSGAYATPQQVKDNVASQYGYLAAFLNDPELGPILQRAAKEGWDSDRLQGAIYKTKWYQSHSDATRQFDAQTRLDPATQKSDIQKRVVDITTQAKRSGIALSSASLAQLATQSLRFGWSDQQLTNAIVAQGKMDISGKTPNSASATAAQLKEQARQYMISVSDGQLMKWVKDIETGNLAIGDFTGYLKEQAKSLFPGLAGAIDRGVTVEQYADPYRQQAAQILEVDPQSIDFMKDPKYRPALFQIDPKTKDRTSMSLADWDTYLRKTPDFAKTHQANQQAAAFGNTLLQEFGKIGV